MVTYLRRFKVYQRTHQESGGFTLIELLITVLVVAILVALGIINYTGSKERAISKEAIVNLKLIAAAEKIYRMEIGGYYPSDGASPQEHIQNINSYLKLSLSPAASRNWDYSVTADTSTFTVLGDRTSAQAPYDSCQYSLTQSGDEPVSSGTCP